MRELSLSPHHSREDMYRGWNRLGRPTADPLFRKVSDQTRFRPIDETRPLCELRLLTRSFTRSVRAAFSGNRGQTESEADETR